MIAGHSRSGRKVLHRVSDRSIESNDGGRVVERSRCVRVVKGVAEVNNIFCWPMRAVVRNSRMRARGTQSRGGPRCRDYRGSVPIPPLNG